MGVALGSCSGGVNLLWGVNCSGALFWGSCSGGVNLLWGVNVALGS
ncbi:MAG TPA: hypothetical protein P5543_10280 [Planctomycetota bacterium]|nr:hypothetical protein [Planctomycetota bacterium]